MNQFNCEEVFDNKQSQLQKKKDTSHKQVTKEQRKEIAKRLKVSAYDIRNMNQKISVYDGGERTLKQARLFYIGEKKAAQKQEQEKNLELEELRRERDECTEKIESAKFQKSTTKLNRELQAM